TPLPSALLIPAPSPPPLPYTPLFRSLKAWHLDRAAVVYVRRSTPQQVLDHRQSTLRRYAPADRAVAPGWPRSQVRVIDDDLGGRAEEHTSELQSPDHLVCRRPL